MGRGGRESAELLIFKSRRTKPTSSTTEKTKSQPTRCNDIRTKKTVKIELLNNFTRIVLDLVELALRANCRDREDEWVRDLFTAHMKNEKKGGAIS